MKHAFAKSVRYSRVGRFFAFCSLALASACQHSPSSTQQAIKIFGQAQGTYYSLQYCDPQGRNIKPAVDSLLAAFDTHASLWVEQSLLRRINSNQTDSLSPILADLLLKSQQICNYTDGAFDCRVGRIVQLWGFSFRQREEPDSSTLSLLLQQAHGNIYASDNRISKQFPETELDFNAIAQGYSVDLLASLLDSLGIDNFLIDIGGEVVARGSRPDSSPWRVGIEKPSADSNSSPVVHSAISLHNAAVVTSGSYRKYYEKDGLRFSHTIDPSTGHPVRHNLLSASVVADNCWLADAMATAYMVMGPDKARQFIADHPGQPGTAAVMLISDSAGHLVTFTTPDFASLELK